MRLQNAPTFLRTGLFLFSLAALTFALLVGDGSYQSSPDGLPDAGAVLTWSFQIFFLIFTILGIRIVGLLVTSTFLVPQENDVESDSLSLIHIGRLSAAWSFLSFIVAVLNLGVVLGVDFKTAVQPSVIATYAFDLAPSRSFLLTGLIAAIIGVVATVSSSLNTRAFLSASSLAAIVTPLLNSHSSSLGDHSLAITSSVIHGVSVSIWVGCLFAIAPYIKSSHPLIIQRFSALATTCVALLALSGIAGAYVRLDSATDLWRTGYGQLVLIKSLLFIVIISLAIPLRTSIAFTQRTSRFLAFELLVMSIAVGVGVALHTTPMSRANQPLATSGEQILGFAYPPPPTAALMFTGWHPEWAMLLLALTAGFLYLRGLRTLSARRIPWPFLRTASFIFGLLIVVWATNTNIARYAMVSFSAHMISHMALSMLAPIFLVLGAPITLALRALPASKDQPRNARAWIVAILHSRYARFITHPLVVLALFTFGLYALYFTAAFGSLMASHTGHLFMGLHFLFTGLLFSFLVIGVDPAPREVPHWLRLILILVAISLHSFFAIAIMQSTTPIGAQWYSQVRPPWLIDSLQDTKDGGSIAWALGDIPSLLLMVLVGVQWSQNDARLAKRLDRQADRSGDAELNAYNAHLDALNRRR